MSLDSEQRPLYEVKANLFKGLAHPLRIRLLELVSGAPEVSVAQLQAEMGLEPSHVSQHLAVLRRHRVVRSERRGSNVYYRLADPSVADLLSAARVFLGGVLQQERVMWANHENLPRLDRDIAWAPVCAAPDGPC